MSKKLIMLMVFALVIAFSGAAMAEVQNVKVGGDTSIWAFDRYQFNLKNIKGSTTATDKKMDFNGIAQIANVKISADLSEAVSATMVLRNERIWAGATETVTSNLTAVSQNRGDSNVYLAAGYVTLKEMFGQPFTLKAGTMGFKLGSGLLVGDADTNRVTSGPFAQALADLSPRKAFTGFVGVLDLKPVTITGGALKVTEANLATNNDDVNAYVLNAGYDLAEAGFKSGIAEAYFVERWAHRTPIDNYGVRVQAGVIDNMTVGGEFCYQKSKVAVVDSNTAILLNAGYAMPDVVMAPSFSIDYTRLSKNWQPMMEDMTPADIANVLFPNTNISLLGVTVGAKPMTDVGVTLRAATMRSVRPINNGATTTFTNDIATYNMDKHRFLGNEYDLHLTYDYTEDVQFGLMGGIFTPGKAFAPENRKNASQVIGSMKVTF